MTESAEFSSINFNHLVSELAVGTGSEVGAYRLYSKILDNKNATLGSKTVKLRGAQLRQAISFSEQAYETTDVGGERMKVVREVSLDYTIKGEKQRRLVLQELVMSEDHLLAPKIYKLSLLEVKPGEEVGASEETISLWEDIVGRDPTFLLKQGARKPPQITINPQKAVLAQEMTRLITGGSTSALDEFDQFLKRKSTS
jgi:hypothetical protein